MAVKSFGHSSKDLKDKIQGWTSCKLAKSSTLQFPDCHILNHRLIVASFVEKGSHTGQAIRNDGFFFVYQCVRLVASFPFFYAIFISN